MSEMLLLSIGIYPSTKLLKPQLVGLSELLKSIDLCAFRVSFPTFSQLVTKNGEVEYRKNQENRVLEENSRR